MDIFNLFDITTPKQWKTISSGDFDVKGKYSVYGANGIIGKTNSYNHEEETILITCRGATCGSVNLSEPYSYVNGNAMALDKVDESKVTTKYLYHFLKQYNFQNVITGSAQPQITRESLRKVEVPLPDLETQNKIGAILDKAKAIVDKREQTIAKYDELLRATFLEMFLKYQGTNIISLVDLADIKSGLTKGKEYLGKSTRMVAYMRVANVQDGFLDLNEIKEIEATEEEIERYNLAVDDLLLTEGGDPDKLGRGTLWKGEIDDCIFQNHIFRVRVKEMELLNPIFLSFQVSSLYGKNYFLKAAKQTSGIASINSTQLKAFPVYVPPLEMQYKFSQIVLKVEKIKAMLFSMRKETRQLFSALSQYSFQGKLKFNSAVDLEILLENDYEFFKKNSSIQSIQFLLERLEKDELNDKKFYDPGSYDKAVRLLFELLKDNKVKQVFDKKTSGVKFAIE
ncbi:restriction endonuclease subunit S [Dyadobacter luticola]|uniref:Restriction endonuclease subunit S n=1 Tax=Dyadobacter luticola TaxID=1979387 RepID=A0A5R9KYJ7_9BACT|nr:restriction endonuclease subunit S [Dyadobacter luticola]TLV01344.1 restriction endonuclease subunit S [Dyadobacter luticola]